jgi:copper chaperone CopZ
MPKNSKGPTLSMCIFWWRGAMPCERLFLLLLALSSLTARAEFLRVEVFMKDMQCQSCSESLGKAFERLRGVKHVDVSMRDGTVTLELADQNRVTLEQVWDAIKRVGFTPGDTKVTVRGTVKGDSLTISVIDKTIKIEGNAQPGEVALKGSITPPPDPRTAITLRIE